MTKEIAGELEDVAKDEVDRYLALRIRTKVREAKDNPGVAGARWPFEILQNALDPGPRAGRGGVSVRLAHSEGRLTVSHDGAPFELKDLSALIYGGSSKDFESDETVGRFGTGFLVTHVLSSSARVDGLLKGKSRIESFSISLDRHGDETAILENIKDCKRAVSEAVAIDDATLAAHHSAEFNYALVTDEPWKRGTHVLRRALPFLFLTRRTTLCAVDLVEAGLCESWRPGAWSEREVESVGYVTEQHVSVEGTKRKYRAIRVSTERTSPFGLMVVLSAVDDGGWQVEVPPADFPRIFKTYPLIGSEADCFNVVFDGPFEIDEKRRALHAGDANLSSITQALRAMRGLLILGQQEEWRGGHLLAKLLPVSSAIAEAPEDRSSWDSLLKNTAIDLTLRFRVPTPHGPVPLAVVEGEAATEQDASACVYKCDTHDGWTVDLPLPRASLESPRDEIDFERAWWLASHVQKFAVPPMDVAADWTAIALGWRSLGVDVPLRSLPEIAHWAKPEGESPSVGDLEVRVDPMEWIARFFDAAGGCWEAVGGAANTALLDGLVPNQLDKLVGLTVSRDQGVSDVAKAVAHKLDVDVQKDLLSLQVREVAKRIGLAKVDYALEKAIARTKDDSAVVELCINTLDTKFGSAQGKAEEVRSVALDSSLSLLRHLWRTQGDRAKLTAQRVLLVASDASPVRWAANRRMMAPSRCWAREAQPFQGAYPAGRILADGYGGDAKAGHPSLVEAIVAWDMGFGDPLITDQPAEVKDKRLAAMAVGPPPLGATLGGESLSHIALLEPEVINHCQRGEEAARALLGLVLCHVAPKDECWRSVRHVKARQAGKELALSIRPALWLADLRVKDWVPISEPDGKFSRDRATTANLRGLLTGNEYWLRGNQFAIALLTDHFGFDALDLQILGSVSAARTRSVRSELALLVQAVGDDSQMYSALVEDVTERRERARQVGRCRKLGLAVQAAVEHALTEQGLGVDTIDNGFDFEVAPEATGDFEDDLLLRAKSKNVLLEVKATAVGEACMTPKQVETASKESARYVLCVVDLRGLPSDRLDGDWKGSDVVPLAHFVTDIGQRAAPTVKLVGTARANAVGIRRSEVLRYAVAPSIWENGVGFDEWVATFKAGHAGGTPAGT